MARTHLTLDPETDATLSAVFDAAVVAERSRSDDDERSFDELRADAFVAHFTGTRPGSRRPPEISVLIDHQTLRTGLHARSVCQTSDGQPIPPATVRRLACEAAIIPLVLDGAGRVLDHGIGRRVASVEQRRALRAMYTTCGHPGCGVRFGDCEVHHVVEWVKHRGPTNLDNLLPLRTRHHHLVQEGGWHLTLHVDRTITLRRPDGTTSYHGSTIDVAAAGVGNLVA